MNRAGSCGPSRPPERRIVVWANRNWPAGVSRRLAALLIAAGISLASLWGAAVAGAQPPGGPEIYAGTAHYEVGTRDIPGLGHVLVDGSGYVLYAYVPDHQGPSKCYLGCAFYWPPLILPRGADVAVAGAGAKRSLLGTTKRKGGALQVTYDRWPLYLYENDRAPGDASGQGDDMGLWYVLSVNGSLDRKLPSGLHQS